MQGPTRVALAVVVDRSGAMESIRGDAEGGVSAVVAEQHGLPGSGRLLPTRFDGIFDVPQTDDADGDGDRPPASWDVTDQGRRR